MGDILRETPNDIDLVHLVPSQKGFLTRVKDNVIGTERRDKLFTGSFGNFDCQAKLGLA